MSSRRFLTLDELAERSAKTQKETLAFLKNLHNSLLAPEYKQNLAKAAESGGPGFMDELERFGSIGNKRASEVTQYLYDIVTNYETFNADIESAINHEIETNGHSDVSKKMIAKFRANRHEMDRLKTRLSSVQLLFDGMQLVEDSGTKLKDKAVLGLILGDVANSVEHKIQSINGDQSWIIGNVFSNASESRAHSKNISNFMDQFDEIMTKDDLIRPLVKHGRMYKEKQLESFQHLALPDRLHMLLNKLTRPARLAEPKPERWINGTDDDHSMYPSYADYGEAIILQEKPWWGSARALAQQQQQQQTTTIVPPVMNDAEPTPITLTVLPNANNDDDDDIDIPDLQQQLADAMDNFGEDEYTIVDDSGIDYDNPNDGTQYSVGHFANANPSYYGGDDDEEDKRSDGVLSAPVVGYAQIGGGGGDTGIIPIMDQINTMQSQHQEQDAAALSSHTTPGGGGVLHTLFGLDDVMQAPNVDQDQAHFLRRYIKHADIDMEPFFGKVQNILVQEPRQYGFKTGQQITDELPGVIGTSFFSEAVKKLAARQGDMKHYVDAQSRDELTQSNTALENILNDVLYAKRQVIDTVTDDEIGAIKAMDADYKQTATNKKNLKLLLAHDLGFMDSLKNVRAFQSYFDKDDYRNPKRTDSVKQRATTRDDELDQHELKMAQIAALVKDHIKPAVTQYELDNLPYQRGQAPTTPPNEDTYKDRQVERNLAETLNMSADEHKRIGKFMMPAGAVRLLVENKLAMPFMAGNKPRIRLHLPQEMLDDPNSVANFAYMDPTNVYDRRHRRYVNAALESIAKSGKYDDDVNQYIGMVNHGLFNTTKDWGINQLRATTKDDYLRHYLLAGDNMKFADHTVDDKVTEHAIASNYIQQESERRSRQQSQVSLPLETRIRARVQAMPSHVPSQQLQDFNDMAVSNFQPIRDFINQPPPSLVSVQQEVAPALSLIPQQLELSVGQPRVVAASEVGGQQQPSGSISASLATLANNKQRLRKRRMPLNAEINKLELQVTDAIGEKNGLAQQLFEKNEEVKQQALTERDTRRKKTDNANDDFSFKFKQREGKEFAKQITVQKALQREQHKIVEYKQKLAAAEEKLRHNKFKDTMNDEIARNQLKSKLQLAMATEQNMLREMMVIDSGDPAAKSEYQAQLEQLSEYANNNIQSDQVSTQLAESMMRQAALVKKGQQQLAQTNNLSVQSAAAYEILRKKEIDMQEKLKEIETKIKEATAKQKEAEKKAEPSLIQRQKEEQHRLRIGKLQQEEFEMRDKLKENQKTILKVMQDGTIGDLLTIDANMTDPGVKRANKLIGDIAKETSAKLIRDINADPALANDLDFLASTNIIKGTDLATTRIRGILDAQELLQKKIQDTNAKHDKVKDEVRILRSAKDNLDREFSQRSQQVLDLEHQKNLALLRIKEIAQTDISKMSQQQVDLMNLNRDQAKILHDLSMQKSAIESQITVLKQTTDKTTHDLEVQQINRDIKKAKKEEAEYQNMQKQLKIQRITLYQQQMANAGEKAIKDAIESANNDIVQNIAILNGNDAQRIKATVDQVVQQDPFGSYGDAIKAIRDGMGRMGMSTNNIGSAAESTLTFDAFKKHAHNVTLAQKYDFPIQAFNDLFRGQTFQSAIANQINDYTNHVASMHAYANVFNYFNDPQLNTITDQTAFREHARSNGYEKDIESRLSKIKNFEHMVSTFNNDIMPAALSMNQQYLTASTLYGADAPTVQKYAHAAGKYVNEVENVNRLFADSGTYGKNQSAITDRTNTLKKSAEALRDLQSTLKASESNDFVKYTTKNITDGMIQKLRRVMESGAPEGQRNAEIEEAYKSFAEQAADVQRKIFKRYGRQLLVAGQDTHLMPTLDGVFNSGDLIEATNILERLTGAQISKGTTDYVNGLMRDLGPTHQRDLIDEIAHHSADGLNEIVRGLSQQTVKNVLSDPRSIGKEVIGQMYANKDLKVKPFNFRDYLGDGMQQIDDNSHTIAEKLKRAMHATMTAAENGIPLQMQDQMMIDTEVKQPTIKRVTDSVGLLGAPQNKFANKDNGAKFLGRVMADSRAGARTKRSLYDLQGADVNAFQRAVGAMPADKIKTLKKELKDQVQEMRSVALTGMIDQEQHSNNQMIPEDQDQINKYLLAHTLGILQRHHNDDPSISQAIGLVEESKGLDQTIQKMHDRFSSLNISRATLYDTLFEEAIPDFIGQLESTQDYFIRDQIAIPDKVIENISQTRQYLEQARSTLINNHWGGNQRKLKAGTDLLVEQLDRMHASSLDYNKAIANHNLQELEDAENVVNNRAKYADYEHKMNSVVQDKTDKVYSTIEQQLQKLMLGLADVGKGDEKQGRHMVNNAIGGMMPRAMMQQRKQQQPQVRFAHPGSEFEEKLKVHNRQQIAGGPSRGEKEVGEKELLQSSRLAKAMTIAKLDREAVTFLRSVRMVKGKPTIDGRELSDEQRTTLARLVVAVTIAMYAAVFGAKSKNMKKLIDSQQQMVADAKTTKELPRFLAVIDKMVVDYLKKRNMNKEGGDKERPQDEDAPMDEE